MDMSGLKRTVSSFSLVSSSEKSSGDILSSVKVVSPLGCIEPFGLPETENQKSFRLRKEEFERKRKENEEFEAKRLLEKEGL